MRTHTSGIVWGAGIFLAVVVLAAGAAVAFRGAIAKWAIVEGLEASLDREVDVDDVSVGWADGVAVQVSSLRVAAPDWAEKEIFASAARVEATIRFWPLFRADVQLTRLEVRSPHLYLAQRAGRDPTWRFGAGAGDAPPAPELPAWLTVEHVAVEDGSFEIEDAVRKLEASGTFTVQGADGAAGTPALKVDLKGASNEEAFTAGITASIPESVRELRRMPGAFDLTADIAAAKTTARFAGKVRTAGPELEIAGKADVEGANLADLAPFFPTPLPPSPPYELDADVVWSHPIVKAEALSGTIGNTKVAGAFAIDLEASPFRVDATLATPNLDFDDLGPLIGLPPAVGSGEAASPDQEKVAEERARRDSFLPDAPLDFAALKRVQGRVKFRADRVKSPPFAPLQSFDVDIGLTGAEAIVKAIDIRIADGQLTGAARMHALESGGDIDLDILITDARLKAFFQGSDYVNVTEGRFDAVVRLAGRGATIGEVVRNGEGALTLAARGGAFSGLLIEGAGIDIAEALVLYIGPDAKVPVNCARIAGSLADGRFTFSDITADTDDSVIRGRGTIDLRKEVVDLALQADAKDFSILDLAAPVHIKGKIMDPEVSIGEVKGIGLFEEGDAVEVECKSFSLQREN